MHRLIFAGVTSTLFVASPAFACDLDGLFGGVHRFSPFAGMVAGADVALPMNSEEQAVADKARADALARERAAQTAAAAEPAGVSVAFADPTK